MIPKKNTPKSYGVLHIENFFSFTGFCKKVNSNEIQKVDIYLNDEFIDTILADKKLQKIEDIYDINGFGFTYVLPNKYIGSKESISFKNHQTQENLQNSPYKLITKNHPKFNEMAFLNSLESPINEESTDFYYQDGIGFLATKENLEDEEFMDYIKELFIRFPSINFYGYSFYENNGDFYNNILINKVDDLKKKVRILVVNNIKSKYDRIIYDSYHSNMAVVGFAGTNMSEKLIEDIKIESVINIFKENNKLFKLDAGHVEKYSNHMFLTSLFLTKGLDKNLLNMLIKKQTFKEWQFNMINIGLKNLDFLMNMNFLRKNIRNLLKSKNK